MSIGAAKGVCTVVLSIRPYGPDLIENHIHEKIRFRHQPVGAGALIRHFLIDGGDSILEDLKPLMQKRKQVNRFKRHINAECRRQMRIGAITFIMKVDDFINPAVFEKMFVYVGGSHGKSFSDGGVFRIMEPHDVAKDVAAGDDIGVRKKRSPDASFQHGKSAHVDQRHLNGF